MSNTFVNASFVSYVDEKVASYRYRILAPSQVLRKAGHQLEIAPKAAPEARTVVFSKHWRSADIAYARFCRARGQKVVFDVCDDHFDGKHGEHYRAMVSIADAVTVNSIEMRKAVQRCTGVTAVIIDDPVLSIPKPFRGGDPSLVWYGSVQNIKGLYEVYTPEMEIPLEVVMPGRLEPPEHFNKPGVISFVPWEPNIISDVADRNTIALVPYRQGKAAKSANRVLEAIQSGMFVIADMLPAVKNIPGVFDLAKGIDAGVEQYKKHGAEDVQRGKEYILRYYPGVIADKWKKILI